MSSPIFVYSVMAPENKTVVTRTANPSGEGSSLSQASKRSQIPASVTHGHHLRAPNAILEE
jgi:hypothetical protein